MFNDPDKISEISIDPETGLLSVVNTEDENLKCFNISVGGKCMPVRGEGEQLLSPGTTRNESGNNFPCLSLVLIVKPRTVMDVCYLNAVPSHFGNESNDFELSQSYFVSDVKVFPKPLNQTINEVSLRSKIIQFPLQGGPFLCSQGMGGHFTHFFPSNYHSIDLLAPVGTPVLAVGNGVVHDVSQNEKVEGILTTNLFRWNSIMLKLDKDPDNNIENEVFVEYVHIQNGSSKVSPGDIVKVGQVLCSTGSVGFSPLPHLHIQMTCSAGIDAKTVPFRLVCGCGKNEQDVNIENPTACIPICGNWYGV